MVNSLKLKGRLRERGLTQEDLARHLGLAVSTANQKINGVRPLDVYEAEKIAKFLDIADSEFCSFFCS